MEGIRERERGWEEMERRIIKVLKTILKRRV